MGNVMEVFNQTLGNAQGIDSAIKGYAKAKKKDQIQIIEGLVKIVQLYSQKLTGTPDVPIDNPKSVLKLAKSVNVKIHGKQLYKQLPDLVEEVVATGPTSMTYGILLPELEDLGDKVGAGRFTHAPYLPIKAAMTAASKGKLSAADAGNRATQFIQRNLTELARDDPDMADDLEDLTECVATFWKENRTTQAGKALFTTIIYETELEPYAKQHAGKIVTYGKKVSRKALQTPMDDDKYKKISKFGTDFNEGYAKAESVIKANKGNAIAAYFA